MILSLLFFSLAASCKAICDNVKDHYYKSIFNSDRFNNKWWDASISWKNKYVDNNPNKSRNNKPIFITDAWHCFNSLMVLFAVCSVVTFDVNLTEWFHYPIIVFIYGMLWIMQFNLFYDKVLNKF